MTQPTYTDLTTLKAYMRKSVDDLDDTILTQCLQTASRQIDSFTGRRFYLDDSASARTYITTGSTTASTVGSAMSAYFLLGELITVEDIGDLTGLQVQIGDGFTWTLLPSAQYETMPDNALALNRPVTGFRYISGYFSASRRVQVTAIWGWPAIPDEVVSATLIQASRLYKRKDSYFGVTGAADWGGIIRISKVDPDVSQLISHLQLPGFARAA